MNYCSIGGVQGPEHRAEIDKAYEVTKVAIIEDDYSVTGEGHKGLLALPEGTTLPVGRQEVGVQHFHRNVRRFVL